jgi:hypothetical protein
MYKITEKFRNWGNFRPSNNIEKKLNIILESEERARLPEEVFIVKEEKQRNEKWPQEWSGSIIIYNAKSDSYFCFELMGNDDDQVTDMLDFYEVKKVIKNKDIVKFTKLN